ncbi:hypothetical protein [Streptomyces sp. SID5789]|uniref:hypothetical protein n=1 Tax=Streptomyces sp. SID5789 TaxID=2690310 RepID=UPI00136B0011|nr:hypothetical protein [Streptomyces sp. SID5789]MZE70143.1 hypothetical protein [Streptomyces sp. SID5789]
MTVTTEGAAQDARALALAVRDRLPARLPGKAAVGTSAGLVIALNPVADAGLNAATLPKQFLGGRGGGSAKLAQGGGLTADAIAGALAALPAAIGVGRCNDLPRCRQLTAVTLI